MKEFIIFSNSCDCISRSHVLSEIEKLKRSPWYNNENGFSFRSDAVGVVTRLCIIDEPSIMPQCHNEDGNDIDFVCSSCHEYVCEYDNRFNYCPYCGAQIVRRTEEAGK